MITPSVASEGVSQDTLMMSKSGVLYGSEAGFSVSSHLLGELFTRLVSRDGVDSELPLDSLDLMLSLRQLDTDSFPSGRSSSFTEPSVSHNIGVDDELLPDTVLAIESFFR